MSLHDDRMPLSDMRHYATLAVSLLGGRTYQDLLDDTTLQLAVLRAVEVVGEASNRVSDAFQHTHPEWPWHQMYATRNALIHGYDKVMLPRVWQTVTEDLPPLLDQLEAALASLEGPRVVPPSKPPTRHEDQDRGR